MTDWQTALENYGKIGAAIAAVIYAAIRGRGWLKRKSAEDGVAIAADRTHVDMLKRCMDEADYQRKRADLAYMERNSAIEELGALRAKVEALEYRCAECDRRTSDLEQQIVYLRGIVDRRLAGKDGRT